MGMTLAAGRPGDGGVETGAANCVDFKSTRARPVRENDVHFIRVRSQISNV
jgi:hypothetical protein